jgi:predicted nucleic acid-binding protein
MTAPNTFHALVDSDAFIGLFYEADVHHIKAQQLFQEAVAQNLSLATTSLVIAETATVLSKRHGSAAAIKFLDFVATISVIHITEELQAATLSLFRQQENKGVSVVDCANVVIVDRFHIPRILGFDQFYRKKFDLKIAA